MSYKVLLLGLLVVSIGFSACKKYEDGPVFSLLTKKQRLTGDWEATKFEVNNQNVINQGYFVEFEFDKDGDFTDRNNLYDAVNSFYGEWEFSGDKEEVELNYDTGDRLDWEITRLTNKELEGEMQHPEFGFVRVEMEKQ